jgi:hypothetical protein
VAVPNLPVSRRSLLLGAAGLIGGPILLAACSGSDSPSSSNAAGSGGSAAPSAGATLPADGFVIAPRFPNVKAFSPGPVRLPISLTDVQASLLTTGPDTLTGSITNEAGDVVASISAARRGTGLSGPYWSIVADLPTTGLYEITIDEAVGGAASLLIYDPAEITMPTIGSVLPGFDTPTLTDARDVDPICTLDPGPCPFHAVSLNEALALGKPVVYMVGTPAHCQFATCGPGLEFLIDKSTQYADRVTFVHAEVYSDPAGTTVAPAVDALSLQYEPVMFFTDGTGTVTNRVDIIWDESDLSDLLAAAFD